MAQRPGTMKIWDGLSQTDPKFTTEFNRSGFKGTAINPTYIARKLTETFGPCGMGWRFVVENENYVPGHALRNDDKALIHVVMGRIDYQIDGVWYKTGSQFGQTTMVGENRNGTFTDEEAPKKSITDALTKCAALLGASADVYLGEYDANKYVNDRAAGEATPVTTATIPQPTSPHRESWNLYLGQVMDGRGLLWNFESAQAAFAGKAGWADVCQAFADRFRAVCGPDDPHRAALLAAFKDAKATLTAAKGKKPSKRKAA